MKNKVKIYRIKSDIITEEDFVVANGIKSAIDTYIEKYRGSTNHYVDENDITSIERISDDCLISEK